MPSLHAATLSGDVVILPDGLHVAVLVIGFSQASREQVTSWGKRLASEYRDDPAVLYYEMPVLSSVPRLMRGLVIGRIKADVPDRARSRFIPILTDEKEWKQIALFRQPDDAYVLVVDSSGNIRRQGEGAPDDALYATIHDGIEAARTNP